MITLDLEEEIQTGENLIARIKGKGIDISKDFHFDQEGDGYRLQEDLRLSSRSLNFAFQISLASIFEDKSETARYLERVLRQFDDARILFGNHPFHHVITGRIIDVVNSASREGVPIPKDFRKYKGMPIEPWQDPHMNYCCLRELGDRPFSIPPDKYPKGIYQD